MESKEMRLAKKAKKLIDEFETIGSSKWRITRARSGNKR